MKPFHAYYDDEDEDDELMVSTIKANPAVKNGTNRERSPLRGTISMNPLISRTAATIKPVFLSKTQRETVEKKGYFPSFTFSFSLTFIIRFLHFRFINFFLWF